MKKVIFSACLLLILPAIGRAAPMPSSAAAYPLYLRAMVEDSQGNVAAAQELLDQAVKLAPESAYLERTSAEFCFRQSQFKEAAGHIERGLALDPNDVRSLILAGQIYWALGDQDKSEARFKRALQLAPDESEALVNLALSVTPKDPKKAVKLYTDFLERHPDELEIQERVAQLYSSMGDVPKAKQAWTRALEISPDSIRAHLASAQLAEVERDTATAIMHYEAVLEQDPSNLPLLLRVGELRYRSDQMNQAYEAFSKAQSIAPNSASANFWLALLAENRGDWNEAIRLIKPVVDKAPEPGVLLRLSYYYSQSGRQKEAIAILKKLSDGEPENTDFLRYLSVAYDQDKQYGPAIQTVQKLVAIDPNNPDPYFRLGTLYDRTGQFDQAEAALKKAIELDPQFHMALNYLGYSYADRNVKLEEAEKLVSLAISLDPDNSAYLDSLGWINFRLAKFKEAEGFLRQASLSGMDPLIWEHLGDAQAGQNKLLDAALSYATSLRHDPQQSKLKSKQAKLLSRLSLDQRASFFLQTTRDDFRSLAELHGAAGVQVCRGKACAETQATFDFSSDGELKIQVSGPLSTPLFLVVVSSQGAPQVGMISPAFQGTESLVGAAAGLLNQVWRGQVFDSALSPSAPTAVLKSSVLMKEGTLGTLTFENSTGRLREVKNAAGRLRLSGDHARQLPTLPLRYDFSDNDKGTVRLILIKPDVEPRRPAPAVDE